MLKEQKGITLVALVVTIIVLLILAGVTIALVLGQNGIIGKAQTANASQEAAAVKDDVTSALAALLVDINANGKTVSSITGADLNKELNSGTVPAGAAVSDNTMTAVYTPNAGTVTGTYDITIDFSTGTVTAVKK